MNDTCDPSRAIQLGWRYMAEGTELLNRHGASARPVLSKATEALFVNLYEHLFTVDLFDRRVAAIHKLQPARVLDFGCGAGYYATALAMGGISVTCLDSNKQCIGYLKFASRCLGLSSLIKTRLGGKHDMVLLINVLDHEERAEALMKRISASLQEDGRLCLYAHFTRDGQHLSGERHIARAFRTLTAHFERAPQSLQPAPDLFEVWIKRNRVQTDGWVPTTAGLCASSRLIAHPEAFLRKQGERVLMGPRFYLRPLLLEQPAEKIWRIIAHAPVMLGELMRRSNEFGVTSTAVASTIHHLWQRRYLREVRADG